MKPAVAVSTLVVAVSTFACGARPAGHATAHRSPLRTVGGRTVATVAGEPVTDLEVRAVAVAEGITDAHAALQRAIDLRLLAREAVRRGADQDPLVDDLARRAEIQSLLTHTIEHDVRVDTLSADDLRVGMRMRGFALAHGELWHVTHVLLPVPGDATDAQRAALRARAEQTRAALLAVPDTRVERFRAIVTTATQGLHARIEDLPAFDREGNFGRGEMAAPFVAAAVQLDHPGDLSPVVQTQFGYHVIMLLDRRPPLVRPESEVRAIVTQELLLRVRHGALDRYLTQLREHYHAEIRNDVLPLVDRLPWSGS